MLLIGKDVSTRYTRRSASEYERIYQYIEQVVTAKAGNYMIFFPSYKMLDDVYSIALGHGLDKKIRLLCQSPNMKEAERESYLQAFQEEGEPVVGFSIMGGIFSEGIDLRGETVIILGAGGAARACAFLCAMKDAARTYVLNRSPDRAVSLAAAVNAYAGRELCVGLSLDEWSSLEEGDVIAIQASSVGLHPDSERAIIEDPRFYSRIRFGFDLVYKPAVTRFMRMVSDAGGRSVNGLGMLLYQGVEAYSRWMGSEVSEEAVMMACRKLTEAVNG